MNFVLGTGKRCTRVAASLVAALGLWLFLKAPSNDRNWSPDQAVLPHADIEGDLITIHNVRNFQYRTEDDFTPGYDVRTYDLSQLKRAHFIVEPFTGEKGAAHTMLSFEFEDDDFLTLSVEARREKGVAYSAVKGAFRQYEIIYVLADERDIIRLRANYRGNNVYVYPAKAQPQHLRNMFMSVVNRVNHLKEHPAFYNTLANNCTTSLVRHVNEIAETRIGWKLPLLLTAKSDELAYQLGLLDVEPDAVFESIRARHNINDLARIHAAEPDFSRKIRQ